MDIVSYQKANNYVQLYANETDVVFVEKDDSGAHSRRLAFSSDTLTQKITKKCEINVNSYSQGNFMAECPVEDTAKGGVCGYGFRNAGKDGAFLYLANHEARLYYVDNVGTVRRLVDERPGTALYGNQCYAYCVDETLTFTNGKCTVTKDLSGIGASFIYCASFNTTSANFGASCSIIDARLNLFTIVLHGTQSYTGQMGSRITYLCHMTD